MATITCSKCSTENNTSLKYCSSCGFELPKHEIDTLSDRILKAKLSDSEIDNNKPRRPIIALIMSLFIPGFGQLYNGQLFKGIIILFSLLVVMPFVMGLARITTTFYGYMFYFAIQLLIVLYNLVDATINANRQKKYHLKNYNKWYYYALIIVIFIGLINFKGYINYLLGTKSFKWPSNSSQPTIHSGDHIVADLRAFMKKPITYGDLVVFKKNNQFWGYRIIGLPNDTIDLKDDFVTINKKRCKVNLLNENVCDNIRVIEFEEELPNGHIHKAYKNIQYYDSTKTNISNLIVPNDCYFLLGDYRDNAFDSRYVGFIYRDMIVGQMVYTFFGKSLDRININLKDN